MRSIEKSDDSATVCANIAVDDPAFLVITVLFVVRLIGVLVERVSDAFFEDPFGVLGL